MFNSRSAARPRLKDITDTKSTLQKETREFSLQTDSFLKQEPNFRKRDLKTAPKLNRRRPVSPYREAKCYIGETSSSPFKHDEALSGWPIQESFDSCGFDVSMANDTPELPLVPRLHQPPSTVPIQARMKGKLSKLTLRKPQLSLNPVGLSQALELSLTCTSMQNHTVSKSPPKSASHARLSKDSALVMRKSSDGQTFSSLALAINEASPSAGLLTSKRSRVPLLDFKRLTEPFNQTQTLKASEATPTNKGPDYTRRKTNSFSSFNFKQLSRDEMYRAVLSYKIKTPRKPSLVKHSTQRLLIRS